MCSCELDITLHSSCMYNKWMLVSKEHFNDNMYCKIENIAEHLEHAGAIVSTFYFIATLILGLWGHVSV